MKLMSEHTWLDLLSEEIEDLYFKELKLFVIKEYTQNQCYPELNKIFRAFDLCSFEKIKVVILGQDPYHGVGQADGLCFSVLEGVKIPPSLRNILKEIKNDLGKDFSGSGSLESWAQQGVLLLNSTLTVEADEAGSHQKKGWERFTDSVIRKINEGHSNVVFILWGNYAQKKGKFIDSHKHLILKSAHPSPLAAHNGFFGNHHFSLTNEFLILHGKTPIDWI